VVVPLQRFALNKLMAKPGGFQIAPKLVERTFGVHSEVVPHFIGVPGNSLLARAMAEGDYLGKTIMDRPDLGKKFPQYQSGIAFADTHPQFKSGDATYHMWISVVEV
jgi:hypothetical protein